MTTYPVLLLNVRIAKTRKITAYTERERERERDKTWTARELHSEDQLARFCIS
jgi:hypothetical protein